MKVLITGGSRGIGEACVRAFCEKGNRVAFLYHTNHNRAKALADQTGAIAICADVADAKSATAKVLRNHNARSFTRGIKCA